MTKLLDRIKRTNLQLNMDKCNTGMTEIQYIGHIQGAEGLKQDQEKVRVIMDILQPSDKSPMVRL